MKVARPSKQSEAVPTSGKLEEGEFRHRALICKVYSIPESEPPLGAIIENCIEIRMSYKSLSGAEGVLVTVW